MNGKSIWEYMITADIDASSEIHSKKSTDFMKFLQR